MWSDDREISIYGLLLPLVRYWGTVLVCTLLFATSAVVFTFIGRPSFTSTAKFIPQGQDSPSDLAPLSGLATQFGLDIGSSRPEESPQFYAQLLETEQILDAVARTRYAIDAGRGDETLRRQGTLMDLLEVEGDTPAIRLAEARETLRDDLLRVETEPDTGVITASVESPWPDLSAAIGRRLLELLNEFNLESRQSQASREREFVEARLEEAGEELRIAEDSLRAFLERTHRIDVSPTLLFERDRLRRQVNLREQVYSSLAESYEQAKINEVRDIPVITIIDEPTAPARPDPPRLLLNLLLGLVLGGMIGIGLAYGRSFVDSSKDERPQEYSAFVEELRRAIETPRLAAHRFRSFLIR